MTSATDIPSPLSPKLAKVLGNVGLVIISMLPVVVSCLARRAFAPVDGFCPLDIFHGNHTPSEHELVVWRWGSSFGFVALAVAAIIKRPVAITLLVLVSLSPLLLVLRFYHALSYIK